MKVNCLLRNIYDLNKVIDTKESMIQIVQVLGEEVPVIKSVISRLLCAVLSTADCERGFSVMKLLKTALRNRISQQHLNAAMLVKIEGPDDHAFDFEQAKAIFCRNKKRRVV